MVGRLVISYTSMLLLGHMLFKKAYEYNDSRMDVFQAPSEINNYELRFI